MRITAAIIGVTLASAGLAGCSGHHAGGGNSTASDGGTTSSSSMTATMPKPGLWTMTVSADGMPKPMTTQMCVGTPAAGVNPFSPPPQPGQAPCAKNAFTKTATGYSIDSECKINGMTMSTTGTVTGDFASAYTIAMKTKMSGPNIPASMQSERASTVDAKYGGACPAGMAPGTVKQAG